MTPLPPPFAEDAAPLAVVREGDRVRLVGALTVARLGGLADQLGGAARIDVAGLERLDTAGAWFLLGREAAGAQVDGLSADHRAFVARVRAAVPTPEPQPPAPPLWRHALESTGRVTLAAAVYLAELAEYLGRFAVALLAGLRHPRRFPMTALIHHAQESGLKAVPIVALMAFLIGVVLAFQGATQLRQFGAEVFVVDLIAISVLRELGILLTAIIVAGRSASALTASIGAMKMREEIDAMRTLGLNPDRVLILPRVLALILTLPILGLIANAAGLVGGAVMSWVELGVSPSMFKARLLADTSVDHVIVGLVKAPVFAALIGIIGCHAGMKVGSDTESLGRMTSMAVVSAIFAVIVADALFSIFFAQVGL